MHNEGEVTNTTRPRSRWLGRWWSTVRPEPGSLKKDAIAGIPGAIGSVPDGMASAVLAGVNPVFGLYAGFAGPIAGGMTASTRLMVITTTTASALAAGSALATVDPDDRAASLFLLVILAGALMVVAGILKLGRYTRFVSHSVMIGFLTGVAANIVFSQIPDLTGVAAEGATSLAKALDVILNPATIDVASLLTGLAAIVLVLVLARTRIAPYASIIALAIPTLLVRGVGGIARVEDIGDIPRGFPLPVLPDLGLLTFDLAFAALAIAAIVLVQGAGVAESAPNRDGSTSNANGDFIAQGAGNIASGFFRGMPVGGSVGQTALNISAGAVGRWASIFSGIWMVVILVAFSGIVGAVAMPTLAAILIVAAVGSLRLGQIRTILRTGPTSKIALIATFGATLFLSIPEAVAVGVIISLLLQLNQEALDLRVVELVPLPNGGFEEHPAPRSLSSHHVTLLDVYGSLFYAGARTLQARLPEVGDAVEPVVVLRLRGRTVLGATAFKVFNDYAASLEDVEGKFYVSGVDRTLVEQFNRAGHVQAHGPVQLVEATPVVGESSLAAYHQAETWLIGHRATDEPENA
ncbi:MAG: SulP family inorganic anion transporter [Actinomycetota bacterium]|nr:SulP family inorganic anion transporter [Actinomycetota bacterium]